MNDAGISNLIAFLWKLERKGFAELRRSLGDGQDLRAVPYVEPFVKEQGLQSIRRQMFYLVAGLFCLIERPIDLKLDTMPQPRAGNLGDSVAQSYLKRERSGSIEKRFVALLDADLEQLPQRLRQMLTLLHADKVEIAWEQLLRALCYWNSDERQVQHEWARSFYIKTAPAIKADAEDSDNTDDNSSEEDPSAVGGN
jgi:CRISPR system Cascade subunit CasB